MQKEEKNNLIFKVRVMIFERIYFLNIGSKFCEGYNFDDLVFCI